MDVAAINRRYVIKLFGGIGLFLLSGCCSLRPPPKPKIQDSQFLINDKTTFLRPQTKYHNKKPSKYCIDVHTHFFNASDVNVKGYIEGPVAHAIRDDALREFLRAMAAVVDEIAGIAPTAEREYSELLELAAPQNLHTTSSFYSQLDILTNQYRDNIADQLFKKMKEKGLDKEFMKLYRREFEIQNRSLTTLASQEFSYNLVRQSVDPAQRNSNDSYLYNYDFNVHPISNGSSPGGILEFVGHMLSYRWMTLRTYQQFYTNPEDSIGIDAVFGALVDFDYWLDCFCRSARRDQMKVQSLLSALSGGYMLPIISYNPWTDIKDQGSSLELVKEAITKYGFVGVKIYPPMGYFPYGNEENPLKDSKISRPDPRALDDRLAALFSWCIKEQVPVMAHTGESRGQDDAFDQFGGPTGWRALLDKFKPNAPIINAAHFGGDSSESKNGKNDWPEQFAKIMAEPNGSHFYGDLGYWTGLRSCKPKTPECEDAIGRLQRALSINPQLSTHIMYGTDWFMTSQEKNWPSYANELALNTESLFPADLLFYQNAINCFGLYKGGKNRARIEERFSNLSIEIPSWLKNS